MVACLKNGDNERTRDEIWKKLCSARNQWNSEECGGNSVRFHYWLNKNKSRNSKK